MQSENPNIKVFCQMIISLAVIGPFWWFAYEVIFHGSNIDPSVREMATIVISNVVPLVTAVIGFWIGSSYASAMKDHSIMTLAASKTTPETPPPTPVANADLPKTA